jgi:hypothetical protein
VIHRPCARGRVEEDRQHRRWGAAGGVGVGVGAAIRNQVPSLVGTSVWLVLHPAARCYTDARMPTTRPRLTITETDKLADTLDAAAARWPEIRSRRELLLRLVEQGKEVLDRERAEAAERRRDAVRRTSGALTGSYEPDYLERLRDDWPA